MTEVFERLPDQSHDVDWKKRLRNEAYVPHFIFGIPHDQDVLKNAVEIAVLSLLIDPRSVGSAYRQVVETMSSEVETRPISEILCDLFRTEHEQAVKEAQSQSAKAVTAIFEEKTDDHRVIFDYQFPMSGEISVRAASHEDTQHLIIETTTPKLAGVEGVPAEVVHRRVEFERRSGIIRRGGANADVTLASVAELARVAQQFGYSPNQLQKELIEYGLYTHAVNTLGRDRLNSLLGQLDQNISSYNHLHIDERINVMDRVMQRVTEEDLEKLARQRENILQAEFIEEMEVQGQRGIAKLLLSAGRVILYIDKNTRKLVVQDTNRKESTGAEFIVSPIFAKDMTHRSLTALRDAGVKKAKAMGL